MDVKQAATVLKEMPQALEALFVLLDWCKEQRETALINTGLDPNKLYEARCALDGHNKTQLLLKNTLAKKPS